MSRISLLVDKILSDFLHQADIKSLNSAKSLSNLIPVYYQQISVAYYQVKCYANTHSG